jgi:hypothetical protein
MQSTGASLGLAIFLVVAPGVLAVYVPWAVSHWHFGPPFFGSFLFRILGALMILAGLPVLLDSFARFAIQGLGTPAPVAPPQRLVATGLYRYVGRYRWSNERSEAVLNSGFYRSIGVVEGCEIDSMASGDCLHLFHSLRGDEPPSLGEGLEAALQGKSHAFE